MSPAGTLPHDAVVLAGGQGRRLGGVSKADVVVAGTSMLDRVLRAARGARRVVVVGPDALGRPGLETVLEDPPLGGPAAGLDAGVTRLGRDGDAAVLVLACDVPLAEHVVPALLGALDAAPGADGAQLLDAAGRPQPLLAVYRRPALVGALDRHRDEGGVRGLPMRRLVEGMDLVGVPDEQGAATDGDTWQAVALLEEIVAARSPMSQEQSASDQPAGSELHRWVARLVEELHVHPDAVDIEAVLDLGRDVADGVTRPAVPLTGFLAGYAVGAGSGDRAAFEQVVAQVTAMAQDWGAQRERGERA